MAIRVLTRFKFHPFITITSPNTTTNSLSPLPPQFFSTKPSLCNNNPTTAPLLPDLLHRYGLPQSQLQGFISENPFLESYDPSEIENSLKILFSLKPTKEFVLQLLYSCPRFLEYEFIKNWESGFLQIGNFLDVTPSMARSILEVSRKFGLGPGDFRACVERLEGLGFDNRTMSKVLEGFPQVVLMNENGIREKIEFLDGVGFVKNEIHKIFEFYPCLLTRDVSNKLKPLFDEFRDMGFDLGIIRREILEDPSVLGLELGELSRCLHMLSTLKCRVPIKEKIFRDGDFRAALEVKKRVDYLCRHGLIHRDALKVVRKEPRVILYDLADIEKKINFLVRKMGFEVLWLVDVPEYLGLNFEKQIVARYNVIEHLRSKGGLGDEVTLKGMIKLSRLRFYNLYVKPYPECEKLFGRFANDVAVKNNHPVGMWKLFKPTKYTESEEDQSNVKSFMDSLA